MAATAGRRQAGKVGSIAGLLVGALWVADLPVNIAGYPGFSTAEQLTAFRNGSWFFVAELTIFVLLPVFAIPFALGLRNVLRTSGRRASTIGAAFLVAAFAVEAVQTAVLFVGMGPLAERYASGTGSERDAALVAAGALQTGTGGLFVIGIIILLVGIASFGYVQRKAPAFRKWVGYFAFANLAALVPLVASLFFVFFLLLFILSTPWIFATAALLWRAPGPAQQ